MWDSISAYLDTLNAMQICFLCAMIGGGLLLLFEIIVSTIGGGLGDASPDGIVEDLGTSDYAFKFFSLFSVSAFLFMSGCFGRRHCRHALRPGSDPDHAEAPVRRQCAPQQRRGH